MLAFHSSPQSYCKKPLLPPMISLQARLSFVCSKKSVQTHCLNVSIFSCSLLKTRVYRDPVWSSLAPLSSWRAQTLWSDSAPADCLRFPLCHLNMCLLPDLHSASSLLHADCLVFILLHCLFFNFFQSTCCSQFEKGGKLCVDLFLVILTLLFRPSFLG